MAGDVTWFSMGPLAPELYMLFGALVLLLFGLYKSPRVTLPLVFACALIILGASYIASMWLPERTVVLGGMFASDAFTQFAKMLILLSGMLVLLIATPWLLEHSGRPFEFLVLMLMSMLGMMLMLSSADFMALYVGLELSSLALYVLASFERDSHKSTEAGLKYFVLGALASGIMLFGISLVYGFTGSTGFAGVAQIFALKDPSLASKGAVVGMVMIMVGFCFKLSAVPFHMWTPDVYEGSPTPVTAFFATAPKIAALALFVRVLLEPFAPLHAQWQQVVVFVSFASMAVGALGAIAQSNVKRMLAFSSIGHVGFMLMGLAAGTREGIAGMLLYMGVYVFMSAGAFACVLLMRRRGQQVEEIVELSGLSHKQPWLAFALAAFMFSMAGIPPLAGFFGKFYVLVSAVQVGLVELAVAGVVASVVSGYYYLRVVKVMYFDEPLAAFDNVRYIPLKGALAVCVVVTVLFFLAPEALLNGARFAAGALL